MKKKSVIFRFQGVNTNGDVKYKEDQRLLKVFWDFPPLIEIEVTGTCKHCPAKSGDYFAPSF